MHVWINELCMNHSAIHPYHTNIRWFFLLANKFIRFQDIFLIINWSLFRPIPSTPPHSTHLDQKRTVKQMNYKQTNTLINTSFVCVYGQVFPSKRWTISTLEMQFCHWNTVLIIILNQIMIFIRFIDHYLYLLNEFWPFRLVKLI